MRGALHCAAKELRVALRDPWALVLWLLVPLTVGAMVTSIAGGGAPPVATLLVVDRDQTVLSGMLTGALGQGQLAGVIDARTVEEAEGRLAMDNGDASALLIVPAGFGDAVLREQPAELELLTNPAQRILPGIVEEVLSVLTDGVFYAHRVFGEQLATIAAQIDDDAGDEALFSDATISQLSVGINAAVVAMIERLDPPALQLAASEEVIEDGPSYALIFFPGVIFMGLLFASQGLSNSFWRERDDGTLRRTLASPLSLGQVLAGKVIAGAAMLVLLTSVLAGVGFLFHGLRISAWLPAIAWLTLSGLVLFGLMAFLQLIAPSRKSASVVTNLAVYPLMMAGGAFFPFEAMPDWLVAIGRWAPNGYLLVHFKEFLIYDAGVGALVSALPVALATGLMMWLLCAWRLRAFAGAAT